MWLLNRLLSGFSRTQISRRLFNSIPWSFKNRIIAIIAGDDGYIVNVKWDEKEDDYVMFWGRGRMFLSRQSEPHSNYPPPEDMLSVLGIQVNQK